MNVTRKTHVLACGGISEIICGSLSNSNPPEKVSEPQISNQISYQMITTRGSSHQAMETQLEICISVAL